MKSARKVELELDLEFDQIKMDIMENTEMFFKLRNREITAEQAIESWMRDYVASFLV